MFTPRQVAMGNKQFKVTVKHGSSKEDLELTPDTSIRQLRERIEQLTQIPVDEQAVLCNGKPMPEDLNITIKQVCMFCPSFVPDLPCALFFSTILSAIGLNGPVRYYHS